MLTCSGTTGSEGPREIKWKGQTGINPGGFSFGETTSKNWPQKRN